MSQQHDSEPISDKVEPPRARILVMGLTGAGKTSFINKASGDTQVVGHRLVSETKDITQATPFILDGYKVELIDTPGFNDTVIGAKDIMDKFAAYFETLSKENQHLTGVIYIHDFASSIDQTALRAFRTFLEFCGPDAMTNTAIVLSKEEHVNGGAQDRQRGLEEKFEPALKYGASLKHYQNTAESAHEILLPITQLNPKPLKFQREFGQHHDVTQTSAYRELALGELAGESKEEDLSFIQTIGKWLCCKR